MGTADVSIVIVNYRSGDLTRRCLAALPAASAPLRTDVIVVDNDSQDGFIEELAQCNDVSVVRLELNRGFAAGVNAGRDAAVAPYIVLLNPDTEPQPGSIASLVEHLRRNPEAGVAAPVLRYPDGTVQANVYRRFPNLWTLFVDACVPLGYLLVRMPRLHPHALDVRRLRSPMPVAYAAGAALAVRATAYEDAGPFDEKFFLYMEETEWEARLRELGWRIDVVPEAVVVHAVRGGGEAAETWSPYYVPSVYRYFGLRGVAPVAVDAVLGAAAILSAVTLVGIALLFPSKRGRARRQTQTYVSALRYIVTRRRA